MKTIQSLREEQAQLARDVRNHHEKYSATWNAEAQKVYDDLIARLTAVRAEIDRAQQLAEIEAAGRDEDRLRDAADKLEKAHPDSPLAKVFARWLRGGDKAMKAEDWEAMNKGIAPDIRATMSTTTGSEGGFTVATEVARMLMDALKAFGGMREVATVIQTSGFGDLNYPTSDGTSETGELIGQNTTATPADVVFGVKTITAYKYSSKIVTVPFELLQDSAIDVEALVRRRLAQRIGRITNTHFTTGTGTAQPNGIVTAASLGKTGTTGQTATIIFDDLVDLIHSIDPAYRQLGNCRFMMNDASMKVIRKLKDTSGRPIFLPGYDGLGKAMPDSVLGYPVTMNQDVATMAANAKSVLFGDFSYYVIRDVMSAQLWRFDDSAFIKLGQIGFLMWARSGGNFTDVGGAVKYYANSAT